MIRFSDSMVDQDPYTITVYGGSPIVELSGAPSESLVAPSRGVLPEKRGTITGYSPASARRLRRTILRIHKRHSPLFVTLTYPESQELDAVTTKRHLDSWMKRLAYRYPTVTAIWRIEATLAGQVHYHLFLYGIRLLSKLTAKGRAHNQEIFAWVRKSWAEVTGNAENWQKMVTQVEPIRNQRKAGVYIAKYMSKSDQAVGFRFAVGRYWGIYNRAGYKALVEKKVMLVGREDWMKVKKTMIEKLRAYCKEDTLRWIVFGFLTGGLSAELSYAERLKHFLIA